MKTFVLILNKKSVGRKNILKLKAEETGYNEPNETIVFFNVKGDKNEMVGSFHRYDLIGFYEESSKV